MRTIRILGLMLLIASVATAGDLDTWRDGPVKSAIRGWLNDIGDPDGLDFIPEAERVAVLDNDGTFWCERPHYPSTMFQTSLLKSRVAAGMVDGTRMPYSAWVSGDRDALRDYGWRESYRAMTRAFAGMPVTVFRDSALAFVGRTLHPDYGVTFPELYYAPMLELARLLETHGFQVWVVTGSEQDFVRSYIEAATGIPPEHVIGSWTPAVSAVEDGAVTVVRGETQIYNGHAAKPGNIETRIGRRPVFAAGNSNNDQPMCLYAVSGTRRGLAIWIHHDDARREYDYDRGTGKMADLVEDREGVHEVSMERDWLRIYREGIEK